jgi:transposase
MANPKEKIKIPKRQLAKFIKQNKATKWIAHYFKVSERTIYRAIKEYGLKGIRKRGRKPFAVEIPVVEKPRIWIPTKQYIDELTKIYHFQNIQYPPTKYVNAQTGICSNAQHNPRGKFTTCTIYYIALESKLFFLYTIQYRYSEHGVSLEEIYNYFKENALDMLALSLENTGIEVVDIIAYHFTAKPKEPKIFRGYTNG